jgi:chemotaxis signal transduction protein
MSEPAERVVVCRVGSERFAIPVSAVSEVVATPPRARMPGVSPAVRGIANVRGSLITTLSGPALLGFPADVPAEWLLLLTGWRGRVGIEVDEVEDLFALEDHADVRLLALDTLLEPLLGPEPSRR